MITYLKGTLVSASIDSIVIEVSGIGYEVKVPQNVLNKAYSFGEEIKIYTYMSVREDGISLFGFNSKDELDVFKMLITVNGIGPKGALGILSTLSVDELRFAVLADDAKTIAKSPGIGTKTASKLILELKDKLKLEDVFENKLEGIQSSLQIGNTDNCNEAVLALTALGYSNSEALQAVRSIKNSVNMSVEDIIKKALTNF